MAGIGIESVTLKVNDDLEALARARYAHCHQLRILHFIKMRDNTDLDLPNAYGTGTPDFDQNKAHHHLHHSQQHQHHGGGEDGRGAISGYGHDDTKKDHVRERAGPSHYPTSTGHGAGGGNQVGHRGSMHSAHPQRNSNDPFGNAGAGTGRTPGKITGRGLNDGIYASPSESARSVLRKRGSDSMSGHGQHGAHQHGGIHHAHGHDHSTHPNNAHDHSLNHHNTLHDYAHHGGGGYPRGMSNDSDSRTISRNTTASPSMRMHQQHHHHDHGHHEMSNDPERESRAAGHTASSYDGGGSELSVNNDDSSSASLWRNASRSISGYTAAMRENMSGWSNWKTFLLTYSVVVATYLLFVCCKGRTATKQKEVYDCVI